jgi:uncharacterized protein (TIGR00369 family)
MPTRSFEAIDPDYAQRVKESFYGQPFMRLVGGRLISVTPGHCEIQLSHKPELTQQHGYFHAGIIGTMADNAGGYAALTLTAPGKEVLTVEYKLNLLLPGNGKGLISRGRVIKAGRTLIVCQSDVFNVTENEEVLAATAIITLLPV